MTEIDITTILERQRFSKVLGPLVTISWLLTLLDGLDANLVSFVAPYLKSQYSLSSDQMGLVFAIHQIGTLIGGFVFSYIADRIGRRQAVIIATFAFGLCTSCFAIANSYGSLLAVRLIDGVPLGGILPVVWALNIEFSPRRYRATIVTLTMVGYSVGTASGGPIANMLIPRFGWKALFTVGGGAAIIIGLAVVKVLPESVKFLVSRRLHHEKIFCILHRIDESVTRDVVANARFVDRETENEHVALSVLFRDKCRYITPLIWMAYIASSFAVFFIVNWTPLVFEGLHYTRAEGNNLAAINSLLGAICGLLLMRFTDRTGPVALTAYPIVACLLLSSLGILQLNHEVFRIIAGLSGGLLVGSHFGMHSVCGLFYPTRYRATGAGWATSIAKVGSIAGPAVGGVVLGMGMVTQRIYLVLAICPAVYAICMASVATIDLSMSKGKCLARLSASEYGLRATPKTRGSTG